MPELAIKHESEDTINNEMNLRSHSKSVLSLSPVNISPTSSIFNFRVSSPTVSHASFPNDLPDISLQDESVSILPNSFVSPYDTVSISLPSSSSEEDIVDDLEKPDLIDNETVNIKSHVIMDEETLEREVRDILRGPYVQQQMRASICSAPGDFDMISQIPMPRKRSVFVKKIPFLKKLKKSDEPEARRLKPFEIYKFAGPIDILLMIIGSLAAIGVGACYPIMLIIYKSVLNALVAGDQSHANTTFNSSSKCLTVVNNTSSDSPIAEIHKIVNYYVILGFANILVSWIAWTTWIIAAERQVRRIRFALFRNILRQEIGWFDLHNTGELTNRLIDDLDRIKEGMSEKVPDFIALLARMLGSLIYSFAEGWKLSLVYLSISPLIIITMNITVKVVVKYTMKEVQAFASASSIVQEVLQNIRTVTAFHGQQKEEERFANSLIEAKSTGIKKGIYMGMCQGLNNLFSYVAISISLWYGLQLVQTDCSHYSIGSAFVVLFGCMNATVGIAQLLPNIQNFAEAAGCGSFVFDIINRQTEIDALSDEGDKPQTIKGDIEFDNVTFTYPAREDTSVLKKLSLKIPSGKTVALVGPSGCGKSTAFQLIQRFYDPDNGRVLLDGKNITTYNVGWLRSNIGIVSQEPVLFTGSIEDNIRFGKPDATDDEVQAAAQMANAHDFIITLPQKYKTLSGDKLSGGQKQRVAIARALISNPKILLLDEATSALDNTSERVVQDALDKAKEGRTTLVIAHRLSTIRNADIIIGIENGEVKENGSHDELMKDKGLYYELVTAQSEKEKETEADSDSETEEDNNEDKQLPAPEVLEYRRASKISMSSAGNSDGYADDTSSNDLSKDNKCCRVPFLFKIAKFNIPEWYWILLGSLVSLGYGATLPLYGLIFANMYSAANAPDIDERNHLIRNYCVIFFLIGLAAGTAEFVTSLSFAKSGEALTMRMRKLTFSAILRQEMDYFDHESNSVGALVTRLSSDAAALKGLTGIRIGTFIQSVGSGATGLIIGFSISWKLSAIILCFAPIIIISDKLRRQKNPRAAQSQEKSSFVEQGGQYASQAIEHIRTVVALHQENDFANLYEAPFNQEFKKQVRNAYRLALGAAISNSLMCFVQCACFGYGVKLIEDGEIQFAQVYKVFLVVSLSVFAASRSMMMVPDYSKAKTAAMRIMKLNERQSKLDPNDQSGIILNDVVGNIEFHDVHFRYPCRPTVRVLRHFSLKCVNGNTTALVGPSGSGKSTTIALLQRFYDPIKGKILLDGHDIKVLNIRWVRSLMGLVQQEPVLFNLSIRDNIAYGDNSREVTQDEIESVARMANIHELIISLPQGYDTMCGAKGSQLSGGQKQRIAIARALIRNPKILLLDEATSALDNKSEKVVQATLDQARLDRTCLTIAHRLSTIKDSAKIAVVNRGKMTEEGTHEELLKQKGVYAKLALSQRRSIGNK